MKILILAFALFANVAFATSSAAPTESKLMICNVDLLGGQAPLELFASGTVFAVHLPGQAPRRVWTTTYSLETTLKSMGMTEADLIAKFRGKKVLLVGEGFGALLPKLLEIGADAFAIDPAYALKKIPREQWNIPTNNTSLVELAARMAAYFQKYGGRLFAGSSTQLGLPAGSVDFVISNMLLNNFFPLRRQTSAENAQSIRSIQLTVLEGVRILKPQGQALFTFKDSKLNKEELFGPNGILSPLKLLTVRHPTEIRFRLGDWVEQPETYYGMNRRFIEYYRQNPDTLTTRMLTATHR